MVERDNVIIFPLDHAQPAVNDAERTPETPANQDDLHTLYDGMMAVAMDTTDIPAEGFRVEYVPQTGVLSYSELTRSPGFEFTERFEKVVLIKDDSGAITYAYEVSVAHGKWKHLTRPDEKGRLWNDTIQFPPMRLANAVLTREVYRRHCAKIQEEGQRRARVRRFTFTIGGRAMDAAALAWARSHYRPGFGSPEWQPK
jgi:hypothetical protein